MARDVVERIRSALEACRCANCKVEKADGLAALDDVLAVVEAAKECTEGINPRPGSKTERLVVALARLYAGSSGE